MKKKEKEERRKKMEQEQISQELEAKNEVDLLNNKRTAELNEKVYNLRIISERRLCNAISAFAGKLCEDETIGNELGNALFDSWNFDDSIRTELIENEDEVNQTKFKNKMELVVQIISKLLNTKPEHKFEPIPPPLPPSNL